MNVLIISRYCIYPSWQGSAQHVRTFADSLLSEGHQVYVISGEDVPEVIEIEQDNYKVMCIPMDRSGGKLESMISSAYHRTEFTKIAENTFRKFNPDVIHTGAFTQLGIFIHVAKLMNIPIVSMVNSYEWLCLSKFLIDYNNNSCIGPESISKCATCVTNQLSKKRIIASKAYSVFEKLGLTSLINEDSRKKLNIVNAVNNSLEYLEDLRSKVDFFIGQNPDSIELFTQYGVHKDKIDLVPQWLVEDKLMPINASKDKNNILNIGFVGSLHTWKGLESLIVGINMLPSIKRSLVQLTIISKGVSADKLKRSVNSDVQLNFKTHYVNNVSKDIDVATAISKLDVCAVPSICRETGPRTLIEAIAQNVPCVCSDSVGNSYLVNDYINGRIFESGNSKMISKIIEEIIDKPEVLGKWSKSLPQISNKKEWMTKMIDIHQNQVKQDNSI